MVLKNVKEYVDSKKQTLRDRVSQLPQAPKLAIVQVGNDPASMRYVRNKIKDCKEVGIDGDVYAYPENMTELELDDELNHLQEFYDGVIVQLPLPPHIRSSIATAAILPEKDVDGFRSDSNFNPATPKGIMDYLKWCEFDVDGKLVVVIGRSDIVGKPMAKLLLEENATVVMCHSHTEQDDLNALIGLADLVICAVGKEKFLDCGRVACPVIDVGINFDESGKLVGDCFNKEGQDATPVPGGVGLLTRCALLDNVIKAKEGKSNAL
jgi:methylenetetrahydrofolate dehydrogenase (NADP+)/methenyltetrahydrofolate cyclohydrolase